MSVDDKAYRHAEAVQDRYDSELSKLPFVSGHAVGLVDEAGGAGPSVGLEVFVFEERSFSDRTLLSLIDRIRSEGVAVRVTHRDFRAVPIPPIKGSIEQRGAVDQSRTDKFDPMLGGISCGPDVNIIVAPWSGTLGLVVHRRDRGIDGVLSNKHVLFYDDETKTVCQPARVDSFWNYKAGSHLEAVGKNVIFEGRETYVDAAVASIIAERTGTRKSVFAITDPITGVRKRSLLRVGDRVVKSGLVTGITAGTIKYTSASDPNAKNQIAIEGTLGKPFADHGDSGSIVLYGTQVIGLLWGSVNDNGTDFAMVSPIEAVFETLKLEL